MHRVFIVFLLAASSSGYGQVSTAAIPGGIAQTKVGLFSPTTEMTYFALRSPNVEAHGFARFFSFGTDYQKPTAREPQPRPFSVARFTTSAGSLEASAQNVIQRHRGSDEVVPRSSISLVWRWHRKRC
jgi:hypothetical protein